MGTENSGWRAKAPVACAELDLALVERVLAKHYGYIPSAARELGVNAVDLRHLTWSKPNLLEGAHEEMELAIWRAWGVWIKALDDPNPRRQEWAVDKILASRFAQGHPLSPAPRSGAPFRSAPAASITFRWAGEADDKPPDRAAGKD